jgi:hypothetical protein
MPYLQIGLIILDNLVDEQQRNWVNSQPDEAYTNFVYITDGDDSQQNALDPEHVLTPQQLAEDLRKGNRGIHVTVTDDDQETFQLLQSLLREGDEQKRGHFPNTTTFHFE